jgi:ketosteroid isomerase-like protein
LHRQPRSPPSQKREAGAMTQYESAGSEPIEGRGDRTEVQQLLDQMARSLTSGDGQAVARLWEAPALVLSDQGAHAVTTAAEVEKFFEGAKEQYNQLGVVDTRPEIQRLSWPTDRLAIAEVRWPWLDAGGREAGSETSTYTFRRDENGRLKLRAVVMHGVAKND